MAMAAIMAVTIVDLMPPVALLAALAHPNRSPSGLFFVSLRPVIKKELIGLSLLVPSVEPIFDSLFILFEYFLRCSVVFLFFPFKERGNANE